MISIWTAILGVLALDWGVGAKRPPPILLVIVDAFFHVVSFLNWTWLCLESVQIEEIDTLRMSWWHYFFLGQSSSFHSTFRRLFLCLSMRPCWLAWTLIYFCIFKTMYLSMLLYALELKLLFLMLLFDAILTWLSKIWVIPTNTARTEFRALQLACLKKTLARVISLALLLLIGSSQVRHTLFRLVRFWLIHFMNCIILKLWKSIKEAYVSKPEQKLTAFTACTN